MACEDPYPVGSVVDSRVTNYPLTDVFTYGEIRTYGMVQCCIGHQLKDRLPPERRDSPIALAFAV